MAGMWYSAGGGAVALGLSESGEGKEEGEKSKEEIRCRLLGRQRRPTEKETQRGERSRLKKKHKK